MDEETKNVFNKQIRDAMLLLMDEGCRIWENHRYVDFDGEEGGKNVWVVAKEGPFGESIDFYSAEEAVDHFMKVSGLLYE
jgi:hypothetical protein